ncbi:ATP-dependent Clp protease proteolytic subunit [Candidatus Dependentiae bacterium]|nr:ATP-dependent Clp protease proteolytic subunit [Candidatus Dependentiae bacterium]
MSGKNNDENKKKELDGLLFLSGAVSAEGICRDIIRLNVENEAPVIQLIINSQGGYCSEGFAIIDIMEWSKIPVYTTGIGMIASMGLLIFMAGEKGHRVITPRTSILSHRYFGGAIGNHSSLIAARKEQDLMHQRIINHYFQHSKITSEDELNNTLLRDVDTWLTPDECLKYGIADKIQQDMKR